MSHGFWRCARAAATALAAVVRFWGTFLRERIRKVYMPLEIKNAKWIAVEQVGRVLAAIPAIRRTFPAATIQFFNSDAEVLRALVAGEVHAGTAFSTAGRQWIAAYPETLHLPFEEPLAEYAAAMAVRKGDLDTLNFFDSWITANTADGWLPQRWQYWFETREWADQVATDPDTVAACEDSFQ